MNDFWNTMFAALDNTSAEEWQTFVDTFDSHVVSEIDSPSQYTLQIDSNLLDVTIDSDNLVYAA